MTLSFYVDSILVPSNVLISHASKRQISFDFDVPDSFKTRLVPVGHSALSLNQNKQCLNFSSNITNLSCFSIIIVSLVIMKKYYTKKATNEAVTLVTE